MTGAVLAGLRYVEVETSRRCNRTCAWCPNGHSSARKEQQLMDWPLFTRITAQLGQARYSGWLAFHNYNEPLLNPRLGQELSWLACSAPHARPAIYTNGDLLKIDILTSLIAAGVRYVRITRYPHDASAEPGYDGLKRWMRQAGLLEVCEWEWTPVRQGLAARWQNEATGVLVEVISPAIAGYNDRGGTALIPVMIPRMRTDPCSMTATSLSIDYRGMVKMCCNVIPDSAAEHEQYVVGSVTDMTLADLWEHPLMRDWRTRHAAADWSASAACRTCVQALPETRR
jgi:Iron-sulfur cluster-binding domain